MNFTEWYLSNNEQPSYQEAFEAGAAHGAEQREKKLMAVDMKPVTPDYFEHEDDDETWRECPDDCDIIESAGGSELIIGSEYKCEVAWRGRQWFRVTKLPDHADDDYEVKLISSSHDFYTATQLAAARLQGADELRKDNEQVNRMLDEQLEFIAGWEKKCANLERVNQGLLDALRQAVDAMRMDRCTCVPTDATEVAITAGKEALK